MASTWWKESETTDDDVRWLVLQKLTGVNIVVAECEYEQFADAIIAEHEAGARLRALLLEGVTGAKAMGIYLKEQRDVGLWADTEWSHWEEQVDAALADAVTA